MVIVKAILQKFIDIFKIFLIFFVKTLVFFILIVYNEKVLTMKRRKNTNYGSLAQSVEHMTFNHGVPGSSPG